MKHKTIRKKILRYLEGDLDEKEKGKIQRHLKHCRMCRDELNILRPIWMTEQPVKRETAPPFLWTRISARLSSKKKEGLPWKVKKVTRFLLRPVLTVVALGFMFYSGIRLGTLVTGAREDHTEISMETTAEEFGLNYFDILPPGSIDARILALNESEVQK